MKEHEILGMLNNVGAIITQTHVVFTSGLHGDTYINKDAVYPELKESDQLARAIAVQFVKKEIDVVIGPAIGGALFAQDVARELMLMTGKKVRPVYAEKSDNDTFVIKRGYDKLVCSKRVLITEDVLTTGGSVKKVIFAVRANGGIVVGVGAICNRGGVTAESVGDVPELFTLININLNSYEPDDCPLCRDGVPINTAVGKGKEFLARKAVITNG